MGESGITDGNVRVLSAIGVVGAGVVGGGSAVGKKRVKIRKVI